MKKITIEKDGNLLRIGNKWYRFSINDDGDFRTGEHILEEVNKKKRDKRIEFISKKLFTFVEPELIMKDALKDLAEEELEKLFTYVKKHKDKLKPKIKKHCVQMKVAGVEIPIRG